MLATPYSKIVSTLYRIRDLKKKIYVARNFAELNAVLAKTEDIFQKDFTQGQRFLNSWRFEPNYTLPKDPLSEDYRDAQLELYQKISEKPKFFYRDVAQEPISVSNVLSEPQYPYSTKNPEFIGNFLATHGYWLSCMKDLHPGARVVEFGSGCGDFSLLMAQTGFAVTATDISFSYTEVIRARANHINLALDTVVSDMSSFQSAVKFDAAVFCESFHHSDDHLKLMENLDQVISPKGSIYFCGEPITLFKYPWSVRLDGESIWAARKHGWLELGFDINYFKKMLHKFGWNYEISRNKSISHGAFVIRAFR